MHSGSASRLINRSMAPNRVGKRSQLDGPTRLSASHRREFPLKNSVCKKTIFLFDNVVILPIFHALTTLS
jgi:hypothetical protein